MHDDHILLGPGEHGVVDTVSVFDLQPLLFALKSLFLDPGDVEHVGIGQDLIKRFTDGDGNAGLEGGGNDAGGHSERRRRNKVEADRVQTEEGDQAVDGPAILEITQKGDAAPIDSTQLGTNGVDIEESL